jgi:DNA polymerase-3 subunit chi
MKSITFYQVQSTLYKVTIPKVIIKILEVAKKVNFLCKDEDEMEYLDSLMWSFSQLSFIPHSTENDKFDLELQDLIIATNFDHLIRHSNFLILSSTDLLANFNIDLVNDIFVITTENVNIKYLLTKLNDKLFGNKMKYFIQNLDSTWKVGYDSLTG